MFSSFLEYLVLLQGVVHVIFRYFDVFILGPVDRETMTKMIFQNPVNTRKVNVGGMLLETQNILTDFYEPFNEQLAALLGDHHFLYHLSWGKLAKYRRLVRMIVIWHHVSEYYSLGRVLSQCVVTCHSCLYLLNGLVILDLWECSWFVILMISCIQ